MRSKAASLILLITAFVASSCRKESPPPCAVPEAATNLHLASMNGGTVVLAWTAVPSVTSYVVEAGSAPGKNEQLRAPVSVATYTATDVKAATYYARVLGVNSCGTGPASSELTVVVR